MPKKWYPTKNENRKANLIKRNRRLAHEMKTMSGVMRYFQTQMPDKKLVNRR